MSIQSPPQAQADLEDDVVKSFRECSRRRLLTSLLYLYNLLDVRIEQVPREIEKEFRLEKAIGEGKG